MVGRHVDEEGELFLLARPVLGAKEAQQLAGQYETERDQIMQSMPGEERGAAERGRRPRPRGRADLLAAMSLRSILHATTAPRA